VVNWKTGALAAALTVFALPADAAAQRPRAAATRTAAAAPTATQVRTWYAELQQIGSRLQAAHARALQDPRLHAQADSLANDVRTAMEQADPGLRQLAMRAQGLENEARQAQATGNQARLRALMAEGDEIQSRVVAVRNHVLLQPLMAHRVKAFEGRLHARMVAVEPQLDRMMARSQDLQIRLARAMQAEQRTPAGPSTVAKRP
jgi:hypothetical protein